MFSNNRPGGNGIFGSNPQQQPNNPFTGNQQQQGNGIFGGNQQQQQQQGGGLFNNQQQQQGNTIFANQQQPQQQQGGIFGNQQASKPLFISDQQQKPNLFGNQQQGSSMFGNQQQQQGGNPFSNQQQGGNPFSNQQQGGNPFNNQQQQGASIFPNQQQQQGSTFGNPQQNQQQGNIFGNQQQSPPLNQMSWQPTFNAPQDVRLRIKACCDKVDPKHLDFIRLDQMNMFKDIRISELPNDIKQSLKVLMNNMLELRKLIDNIKRENETLNKQANDYCTKVHEKLVKYKEVLIQNIQQSNLLEDVQKEVELIQKQAVGVIIPLYNAHSTGAHQTFDSPDEFSATIAKQVLQKMIELNNKVDEIISCHQQSDSQELSQQDANTLMVMEELLAYYENVSAKVLEFSQKYKTIKRVQIEKSRRTASYEEVIKRIQDRVRTKLDKDFKCYDMIKEIEEILEKREKREEEYKEKNPDRARFLRYDDNYSQGWSRYGNVYQ